ncbi:hypothetical protein JCM5353_001865 [Sporobolomyces roseus]
MSTSPYKGRKEALVLGIDVGSTSSAVSIAHLTPGALPSIRTVTSWPYQPLDSKLPSVVGFSGNQTWCGAELSQPNIEAQVNSGRIRVCKLFKLHLHPQSLKWAVAENISSYLGELNLSATSSFDLIPDFAALPLPPGIPIDRVYSTFIAYLVKHAQTWFEENTLGGDGVWSRLSSSMEIVMGIPDGWDEHQCEVLKKAIVASGVIGTKEKADKRVEFLRESEASVHFALESDEVKEWMKAGVDFTVADLGGSTCDTCISRRFGFSQARSSRGQAFRLFVSSHPFKPCILVLTRTRIVAVQAGGVYVDRAAKDLVASKLKSSRFNTTATLATILSTFEKQTKRQFHGGSQTSIIKFGGMSDTDLSAGIRSGRLTLTSSEVASTFKFCKDEIVASVKSQVKMGSQISRGFGESEYLCDELNASLTELNVPVIQCSGSGNKPVAEGLVLWHLSRTVGLRAVRRTYGGNIYKLLAHQPPGWRGRKTTTLADGKVYVDDAWKTEVQKGTVMAVDGFWENSYCFKYRSEWELLARLPDISSTIYEYTGDEESPRWMTTAKGMDSVFLFRPNFTDRRYAGGFRPEFRACCTVYADLTGAKYHKYLGVGDVPYWQVSFRTRIFVAQTMLKAQLVWTDQYGCTCEGPASAIVFESDDNNTSQVARRRAV